MPVIFMMCGVYTGHTMPTQYQNGPQILRQTTVALPHHAQPAVAPALDRANDAAAGYEVAIVGGGIIGTALLYALARYTNISHIVLLEKHAAFATVNSSSDNNSQTLHFGDIETNYTADK